MIDLTMSLTLLGFFSGFLGWAGLLGSANDFGKLMFVALLVAALALTLFGIGRSLYNWYRLRPRYSGRLPDYWG